MYIYIYLLAHFNENQDVAGNLLAHLCQFAPSGISVSLGTCKRYGNTRSSKRLIPLKITARKRKG